LIFFALSNSACIVESCAYSDINNSRLKGNRMDKKLALLKKVFFAGMLEGFAGEAKRPSTIRQLPGSQLITLKVKDVIFTDCWHTSPLSNMSFGTIILGRPDPVWMMQYWGMYPDRVIPLLKDALQRAHLDQRFVGGRGPLTYQNGDYIYVNTPTTNDFESFAGKEVIVHVDSGSLVGWHEYRGMMLR
jgi:hypothetical protein